ncbi:MAG: endonuclease/exonuclease/phosphatase family protein [Zymomonas mobilis]|uniref:Endonuclease/exonuclease/phosphatase family metal-dependent hydrolase n=1 Tax=Zymomonas mobilis TaxID=542 RepID=A0A542VZU7_ZYMMB|nr:endonuclease/exonuclease/phosphatase family protein [Zymomonas mobilis]TQL16844.1 endonuclease/exonuclease/phosphatase family metal-dependent hydrolase [Zymomonas mobilis]
MAILDYSIKVASYNIHKAVGADKRRDPERILSVLDEIDADCVILQEADRRLGKRRAILPFDALTAHGYTYVPLSLRSCSLGWHGNAMLFRNFASCVGYERVRLPRLEPRGAIICDIKMKGRIWRFIGAHLDLSGLFRRRQVAFILDRLQNLPRDLPTVIMGDFNQWRKREGCLRLLPDEFSILPTGASFPANHPLVGLDRIITTPEIKWLECGVHNTPLARQASDHLPVWARLALSPVF